MGEQVVNYRRSVLGQNEQLGRKYFSDQLDGFWGSWIDSEGTLSIEYDGLPDEESNILARLAHTVVAPPGTSWVRLIFNDEQCVRNKVVEFWLKGVSTDGFLRFFFGHDLALSFPTNMVYVYTAGNTPTTWTKYTIELENTSQYVTGAISHADNKTALSRVGYMILYWNNLVAGDMSIAGFNIRRLP